MFMWAVAEAIWWPLVPDSFLMGLAFAAPKKWRRLWLTAVAGTVVGGLIGITLSHLGAEWGLPLVTDRMIAAADVWLDGGSIGLAHQPLSGVPYKVFVTQVPAHDISMAAWVASTIVFRGGRMLIAGALAAFFGSLLWNWAPKDQQARLHATVVGAATIILFAGLFAVVRSWA